MRDLPLFVFVLYRNYEDLLSFMERQSSVISHARLVVVDNTESNQVDEVAVRTLHNDDRLIYLRSREGNVGYLGAANHALRTVPSAREAQFLCVANTDLVFDVESFARTLTQPGRYDDAVGLIAPRLVGADGSPRRQLHYRHEPDPRQLRRIATIYSSYQVAVAYRLLADVKRRLLRRRRHAPMDEELFAPHGALMVFTRRFLTAVKELEMPTFLFCEEYFVGRQGQDLGLTCVFDPDLTYAHDAHGSMGHIPSRRVVEYMHESHAAAAARLSGSSGR